MLKKDDFKFSNKELAKKYKVSERTVMRWKKRFGEGDTVKIKKVSLSKNPVEKFCEKINNSDMTEKQKEFCLYYIQSFNATQSALKAGYAKSGAFVEGHRLLKKPKIKLYLDELREMQFNELMLDGNKILERHAQIAFSDTSDFLNDDGQLKKLSEVDGTLLKKIKIKDTEFGKDVSIELENREKSLEFLTKYKGLDPKTELEKQKFELDKKKLETGGGEEKIIAAIEVISNAYKSE